MYVDYYLTIDWYDVSFTPVVVAVAGCVSDISVTTSDWDVSHLTHSVLTILSKLNIVV